MSQHNGQIAQASNTYDKTSVSTKADGSAYFSVLQLTFQFDEIDKIILGLQEAKDAGTKATVKIFTTEREGPRGTFLSSFAKVGPTAEYKGDRPSTTSQAKKRLPEPVAGKAYAKAAAVPKARE